VTKLPERLKSETVAEETFERRQRAPRGDWRWRIEKEKSRNLRDPRKRETCYSGVGRPHSSEEGFNPPRAKGVDCKCATIETDGTD